MKTNIIDIWEKTGDMPKWKPVVGAIVEVFEDVMTQHKHEGCAKIVKIHSKKNGILDCDVRFYKNIFSSTELEDVVRRQIKI